MNSNHPVAIKTLNTLARLCCNLGVQLSDCGAVDLSPHLQITGFFPSFFSSIISFKWEPGLWQTSYGGGLIQPKSLLWSGWIVNESSFIQSQQQELHYSKWSLFELSAFLFVCVLVSIIILNSQSSTLEDLSLCVQNWLYLSVERKVLTANSQTHCITAKIISCRLRNTFLLSAKLQSGRRSCNKGSDFLPFMVFSVQQGSHVVITIQKENGTPTMLLFSFLHRPHFSSPLYWLTDSAKVPVITRPPCLFLPPRLHFQSLYQITGQSESRLIIHLAVGKMFLFKAGG